MPSLTTSPPLPEGRDLRVDTTDGGAAIRAANFYSKMAGGNLQFTALIGNEKGSPLRNGRLLVQNFEVRNEAALAQLDQRGKPKKSGPRKDGLAFKKLWMPFTIDGQFVRMGDVILRGSEMCATASGVIRKADGALDITGTVIPVCGLSGVFNNVPLIGEILTGGNNNEGIFGMTYAMSGSLAKPNVRVNPVSVLAPGLFRRFFDFHKNSSNSKVVN
jgi:AsmA-like C-terminal region